MKKAKTCKHNANRKSSDIVLPFCTFKPPHNIPPNIGWYVYEKLTEKHYEICKCYEKAAKYD